MTTHIFSKPSDIRDFGKMVDNFSEAGKGIARALSRAKLPQEDILRIVGRGRYNTLEAQGYILRGPEAHKAARDNIEGLFGAFFYVHLPELRMAMQLPKLMGEAGCKFTMLVDGEHYAVPLQEVKFGFTAKPAAIIVTDDVVFTNATGRKHRLAAHTTVMKGREWVRMLDLPQGAQQPGRQVFCIIDKDGRGIQQLASAEILWGQQGAKGMKALREDSREMEVLQTIGTDDDIVAEGHLISALEVLARHGIDLMPAFNRFVEAARDGLAARPELLRSMHDAVAVCDAISHYAVSKRKAFGDSPYEQTLREHYRAAAENGVWGDIDRVVTRRDAILATISMLGLPEPQREPLDPAQANMMAQIAACHDRAFDAARRADGEEALRMRESQRRWDEQNRQREQTRQLRVISDDLRPHLMQDGNLFDVALWRDRGGNRLRHPATFEVYRQRFEHRLAATATPVVTLEQLAGDVYQAMACRRIGHAAGMMGDHLRGILGMPWMREVRRDDMDASEAFSNTLYGAEQSLKKLEKEMEAPEAKLKDLSAKANAIRDAVMLLDRTFGTAGSHPETVSCKEIHAAHAKRSFEAARVHWQRSRREPLIGLLNTLEAVEYDPVKWMQLYRHCDAVMGVENPAAATVKHTHAAEILQRRADAGTAQAAARV